MKETIAVIAALMAIAGNVPYVWKILRGTVRPHPYTWLVWTIVSGTVFFGQVAKGAGVGAIPTFAAEIFTLIIFLLSLKYGFKGITRFDTILLVVALLGLIPWMLTNDPTLSVVIAVLIDLVGFIPTLRKTWAEPTTESPVLYVSNVARHALALFSLEAYNVATMLHSVAMIIVNTLMTTFIVRRTRVHVPIALLFCTLLAPVFIHAQTSDLYFFEREDCAHCQAEKVFLSDLGARQPDLTIATYDVIHDATARSLFNQVTEAAGLPKVTPVTIVGNTVLQGFDTAETTGVIIERLLAEQEPVSLERLIAERALYVSTVVAPGCETNAESSEGNVCIPGAATGSVAVPILGSIDVAGLSLVSISALLGFVDGFNPCAMWVLITFLLILSQVGDRRRMWQIAGLFILAEALMYNLILNVWYTTWDFIALDAIVTPIVGVVALGGGIFFLWRWWKSRKQSALVCDITSEDQHSKLTSRMQRAASGPLTFVAALGIIGIAFSVNIIEFACSIGIPQAYTKLLELNAPDFLTRQAYLAVYTLFYMIDDFIVFGLALWGFGKLQAHGAKYANWSALIGGIALLALGVMLLVFPNALVF